MVLQSLLLNTMDIISHTLTGIAVGTVVATLSNKTYKEKAGIMLIGALGGALPDLDAISLWSKFDTTLGAYFRLAHTGRQIYTGKFWYSHHAAMHSMLAPLLFLLIAVIIKVLCKKGRKISNLTQYLKQKKFLLSTFFLAYMCHLLEDMPTPASVWGGVNLFYPSTGYIGGYGKIWWWNNYDLVIIVSAVILLNLIINSIPKRYHSIKWKTSIAIFFTGLGLFLVQINTRTIDFSYEGSTTKYSYFESESKKIQKEILGDKLYHIMSRIDSYIPLHF